ncbi:MAG: exopolysaccharide biosynthesis polyprenyl glycosylphosphotransferase [Thermoanaerobaculia bacterium]
MQRLIRGLSWWQRAGRTALLMVSDLGAVSAAFALAYALWARPVHHQRPELYLGLTPLLIVFVLAYAFQGLYPGFGLGGIETLRRLSSGTLLVFLSLGAISFAFQIPYLYSRMMFGLALVGCLVALPTSRFALLSLLRRARWWREPCVVVGASDTAHRLVETLTRALTLGYLPVARLAVDREPAGDGVGVPLVGTVEEADRVGAQGIRIAVVVEHDGPRAAELVERLQPWFRSVILVREQGGLPVEGTKACNLGGLVGVAYVNELLRPPNRWIKRAVDLLLGSLAAVLSLPLLLLGGLLVRLSSRGPVLFGQQREGLGGVPIRIWKLRTMFPDAEERLERHLADSSEAQAEWERAFKLARDPRIVPRVGRLLRRFSLDELPQLWQVVAGTLSLVGPRPFPEYHLQRYDREVRELRRRVRPGVTGLWQVMLRSDSTLAEQQSHDAYYIRNWSLWMDLYVLGRTVAAVLRGRGAH